MSYKINDNKKIFLRKCAIQGARNYHHYLINKTFLVICKNGEERNIRFFKNDYMHLTGLKSNLNEDAFFEQCKNSFLNLGNISQYQKYNWATLKGKAVRIQNIHKIIYSDIQNSLFIFNLHTNTADFPIAIRNSAINTCVTFKNSIGQARSLRKFTNSNNSDCEQEIAAIFAKTEPALQYNELVYISNIKEMLKVNTDCFDKCSDSLKIRLKDAVRDSSYLGRYFNKSL